MGGRFSTSLIHLSCHVLQLHTYLEVSKQHGREHFLPLDQSDSFPVGKEKLIKLIPP